MRHSILLTLVPCLAMAQALTEREKLLLDRIEKLEQRVAALEKERPPAPVLAPVEPAPSPSPTGGATVTAYVDGYYQYNFNHPVGGVNVGRAYDVSSNSFNINQAGVILERAPDPAAGRRFGGRLDLLFGQAAESLQGNPSNEPRPQVYRNLYQAYGTYVAPLGHGLTTDFGKWASSFGAENNYTKDQLNYTRSFWFTLLPAYHMGMRTSYPVTGKLTAAYWLINGTNQTEDFNGFHSQAFLLSGTPTKNVSWNVNYWNGRESHTVDNEEHRGRLHIVDSYAAWNIKDKWTLLGELDWMSNRVDSGSVPQTVIGGAAYVNYRFTNRFRLAGRFEVMDDRNGLFAGHRQTLKEGTLTAAFDLADGFQMRWELRHDASSAPYFHTAQIGVLSKDQTTALMGLIWWFGGKQGIW